MKKLAVVGRGTVGCMTAAHFLRHTDYAIDWIYDPAIIPAAVGEGTTLNFPRALQENLMFDSNDMITLNATPKVGISKRNWGTSEKEFLHPFPIGAVGIHFSAVTFQDYVFEKLKANSRINLIEKNVNERYGIDADHVIMCTGSPTEFGEEYRLAEHIPVNAAFVSQCPWDHPRFSHTLTYAMSWGWVFGIPLQNRCAIGYIYNDKFATEEQVKEEVAELLKELNLVPSVQRSIKFNNYFKKNNFSERVVYNGNASFFLEPLEATSTGLAHQINLMAADVFNSKTTAERANFGYANLINEIEGMISLHYFAGSSYKNDFWTYAESLGTKKISQLLSKASPFSKMIITALTSTSAFDTNGEVGTWTLHSWKYNIKELGITEKLKLYLK